jgi:S-DNA-T family DNA segregation ATPase FtsK/SpoIIIE
MMTDQRPGIRGNAPLARHHRAMILDTCGIAVAGTWLLAVLMPSPVGIEAGGLAVAGFTVGAVILALTGSGSLASSVAGWGLALSGWITYAHFAGHLWAWRVLGLLILPAIILTGWSAVAYARHVDAQQAGQADEARQVTSSALLRWGRMLDGLGISGVQATAETRTRAGRQVTLRLPGTGRVTIKALVQAADGLAAAAKLPEGAVSFEPGRHAGEVIMHLDEHDVMAEPVLFPDVIGELTINAPLPVGVLADLTVYEVLFREVSAMVVGVSGNGKSNLLNVLIAQLTRCVDVIVIVIDLKGGRLAAPWIRPWIEERCDRPAVDWVATTRAEAAVVLKTMVDVVAARGASLVGGSKIIPSSGLPQFVIIADEMAADPPARRRPDQCGDG